MSNVCQARCQIRFQLKTQLENLKSVYLYWNVCSAWPWWFDGSVKQPSLTGRHGLSTHVERCSKLGGSLVVLVPPAFAALPPKPWIRPPSSRIHVTWRPVRWKGAGPAIAGFSGGGTMWELDDWSADEVLKPFLLNPWRRRILFLINFYQNYFSQSATFTSELAGPLSCNSGWGKKKIHGENTPIITGDLSSLW